MNDKHTENIIKQLQSKNNDDLQKTLERIRNQGNDALLEHLGNLYISNTNAIIRNKIAAIFMDLKQQSSVKFLIKMLQETDNDALKKLILSSCWQSRLDFTQDLEIFIDFVIHANFELSFEAFSVIENVEQKISHQRKHELMDYIQGILPQCREENLSFANNMAQIIHDYHE